MQTKHRLFLLLLFQFFILNSQFSILNCSAQAAQLSDNGNGTVTDSKTGLVWQQGEPGAKSWGDALNYCEGLSLGGADDWRLPNVKELESLTDDTRFSPALDRTYFPNAATSLYWSSTTGAGYTDYAWSVYFYYGYVSYDSKYNTYYVRCVRGGQSGALGALGISPSSITFAPLYIGQSASRTLTLSNTLPASVTIGKASLSGENAPAFSLGDTCSDKTIASQGSCSIVVDISVKFCGPKTALLTIPTSQGNLTVDLSGQACGVGNAQLGGKVTDALSKQALGSVAVMVGSYGPYTTNASGIYQTETLPSGSYEVVATKSGYDVWRGSMTLVPNQTSLKNISLSSASGMRVMSLTSKYSSGKPYYFLPGVSFEVTYTAEVDWNGKTPGKVRFITSHGSYDVATSGSIATKTVNVGTEIDACGTLQAIAIAGDGSQTAAKSADFMVTKPLPVDPGMPAITTGMKVTDEGGAYRYTNSLDREFLNKITDVAADIPLFEKAPVLMQYIPEIDFSFFGQEGKASYDLKFSDLEQLKADGRFTWRKNPNGLKNYVKLIQERLKKGKYDWRHFPKVRIGGFDASMVPEFNQQYSFEPASCGSQNSGWKGSLDFLLATDLTIYGNYHFAIPVTPPIPMYAKASINLAGDFSLNVTDTFANNSHGTMHLNPTVTFSGGPGLDDVAAIEATAKGGMKTETDWYYDQKLYSNLKYAEVFLEISARAYLWKFEREVGPYTWTRCVSGVCPSDSSVALEKQSAASSKPTLIPRTYLQVAAPANFKAAPAYSVKQVATETQSYSVASAPIVTSTFPASSASLSSSGSNVNLLWLTDNAERTSINGTMLQHASFDGAAWSTPVAVADNGTADFSPTSLTFSDGSMVAAWEDMKTTLPDTAQLEDMAPLMEIAAAVYNPATKTWGAAVRLTDNGNLDRSPKLAGKDKSNLLLTWISNSQNDLNGSATKPNSLYAATYNGTVWSAPQLLASIPNAIKRYSAVYDGTTANIVLSLDTDGDTGTLEDLELYRLTNSGGTWSSLTRLTTDTIIDDNPQLALDSSNNVVMTWVRGNELSSVVNFDFDKRTVIRTEESYSNTLADYKQAQATDGKVAVIYADTSEGSTSDLFGLFYDPVFKVWGEPKQLTFDAETEQWPSLAFLGADTIISVYNRKLLINPDGTPTTGALTDLYMLKHTMGDDLALEAGSLVSDPRNPAPDTAVTLSAVAQNLGDKVTQNVPVSFYNGDPASGGTLISTVTITGPFKPGEVQTVSIPWTIPASTTPYLVYAVIDPSSTIDTLNRANNVISSPLAQPDLDIQKITWEKLAATTYSMIVTVANVGGTASAASTVTLHNGSSTGPVITNLTVPALERFASVDLAYEWDASATVQPYYTVVGIVDEANTIAESDELNNSVTVVLDGNQQDISVTPNPLSGTANVGQLSTALLNIRNAGTAALAVSAIGLSGTDAAAFNVAPAGDNACASLTPTIEAGLSCTIGVSITPAALLTSAATVTIVSNDPDTPSVAVPVSVTGVDTGAPVISTFEIPAITKTKTIPFTTLTATDNVAITGWMVTETGTAPAAGDAGWLVTKPTGYAVTANGSKTIYIWAKDAAGNLSAPVQATTSVQIPNLTVSITGSGSVSSSPAGISCASGTCSSLFDDATGVTLTASPGTQAIFTGWSGDCTNSSGSCSVTMTADRSVTAAFTMAAKIKIGSTGYSSFADAYAAASATDTTLVYLLEDTLPLSTLINKKLNLQGGYYADFTRTPSGYTVLQGTLTIGSGSIIADRIVVK